MTNGRDGLAEQTVARWHDAVNAGDFEAARGVVTDPIVVNGPKGAGAISPDEFCEWITRSGIRLHALSCHVIGERILVIEQDARWPQDTDASRVATVFRTDGERVSAALRFPDLSGALDFAHLYQALAATESNSPGL